MSTSHFNPVHSAVHALCSSNPEDPNSGWEYVKSKNGVKIFKKSCPSSPFIIIRAETIMAASVRETFEFLRNLEKVRTLDSALAELKRIEELGAGRSVVYSAVKLPWPASNRDFVCENIEGVAEDHGFCVGHSVQHHACPERKGYVRGHVLASGYLYRALPGDNNQCRMVCVAQVDPKVCIPTKIVNLATLHNSAVVAKIRDALLKEKKRKMAEQHSHSHPTIPRQPLIG
eukprot:GILK01012917.1.p1 GENE.GILK01012917.1~~GILK01012917.1.p1  ORF type:complete len:230 (-),score=6.51 GILK01012917.1:188-877(-)